MTHNMNIKSIHISAPGKLILCGEHAVVYGKKAIACSINLRTNIYANKNDDVNNHQFIEIKFKNLNNKLIKITQNDFVNLLSQYKKYIDNDNKELIENSDSIDKLIVDLKNENVDDQLNAVKLLLLLLNKHLCWENIVGYLIEIDTKIPIGAGLGSSASLSACLVAVILMLNDTISVKNSIEHENFSFSSNELGLINKYTFNLEKLFHGKPSGIDNTCVINGNFISYQNGIVTDQFKSGLKLNILIINTNMEKKTREQVDKVRQLYNSYKKIIESLINTIDLISNEFVFHLKSVNNSNFNNNFNVYRKLNELISINQGLLYSLNISNYKFNEIINISNKYNYSCKITGAGGGGCCFSLITNKDDYNDLNSYKNYLNELNQLNNISYFETLLGCDGIKIEKISF